MLPNFNTKIRLLYVFCLSSQMPYTIQEQHKISTRKIWYWWNSKPQKCFLYVQNIGAKTSCKCTWKFVCRWTSMEFLYWARKTEGYWRLTQNIFELQFCWIFSYQSETVPLSSKNILNLIEWLILIRGKFQPWIKSLLFSVARKRTHFHCCFLWSTTLTEPWLWLWQGELQTSFL